MTSPARSSSQRQPPLAGAGAQRLFSVGIDLGTTTTQLIFSALDVTNRAPVNQVPRYEFSRREVLFESPVIFTPFTPERNVDITRVLEFVDRQYAAAGLSRTQVQTGAIIITGETSKTRTARNAVMEIADRLGNFVVATAGPHLESLIAGRGSGAAEFSRLHEACVMNIDIGGGTANYAVFRGGRAVDSACLNVGGHLLETDPNGGVTRVHEPARRICAEIFGADQDPLRLTPAQLGQVARRMAELIIEVIRGTPSTLATSLLMTPPLAAAYALDALFISGGVGYCLYHPEAVTAPFMFGDIGPHFALALRPALESFPLAEPPQTVRATVIGAGVHTLSLSGSTIWVSASSLPIKNLPVAHAGDENSAALSACWDVAVRKLDLDPDHDAYALALPENIEPLYRNIVHAADELSLFCNRSARANAHPLIVICPRDIGKALGMELQPLIGQRELAVVDEIHTREGDYLDIGTPLFNAAIVPVTIKSLAFPS